MSKEDFFEDRIKNMIEEEEILSKQIYAQNKIDNMDSIERLIFDTQRRWRARREEENQPPIIKIFKGLNLFQKFVFIIMQASASIFTVVFLMMFGNNNPEQLFIWSFIVMIASIIVFTISQKFKYERRNNRNYFRN
jgi:hypothetical protein